MPVTTKYSALRGQRPADTEVISAIILVDSPYLLHGLWVTHDSPSTTGKYAAEFITSQS